MRLMQRWFANLVWEVRRRFAEVDRLNRSRLDEFDGPEWKWVVWSLLSWFALLFLGCLVSFLLLSSMVLAEFVQPDWQLP